MNKSKLQIIRIEMFFYKMIFILLLISTFPVNAITLTGDAEGSFLSEVTNTLAGSLAETTEFGLLSWGSGVFGVEKSFLKVEGTTFSVSDSNPFKVASLTYKNDEIFNTTDFSKAFSNVELKWGLNFSSPSSIDNTSFNYNLTIVETSNNSSNPEDTVTLIPTNDFNPLLINSNEGGFYFELLGFSDGSGGFYNSFIQPEESTSTVDLYAKITAVPIPSALWLFMTALSGFIITGNRKRS